MLPVMRRNGYLPEMFDGLFNISCMPAFKETMPKINVIENDKEYRVELAAAGAKKENFNVSLTKEGDLNIKFENKSEAENKDEKYLRKEFSFTEFEKTFLLSEDVNKDAIEAKVNDGVLTVVLPKVQDENKNEVRTIAIAG